jgi:hypothetical protein
LQARAETECRVINLMPEFWRVWEASAGLPEDERAAKFMQEFVTRHAEIYQPDILAPARSEVSLSSLSREFVSKAVAVVPQMRKLSAQLQEDLPDYLARFRKAFPSFRCEFSIYFLPSLGMFDGAGRNIEGRVALLFGVDEIARIYENADLGAFFTHELFHRYHAQVGGEGAGGRSSLYQSLWEEGLATYVSHVLNPGVSESVVLGRPPDLAERARPMLPKLAAELLENFDSTSAEEYAAFFYGRRQRGEVPPRSGYYVGYLVAWKAARGRNLDQLAHLKGDPLRREIRAQLTELAKGNAPQER